MKKIIIWQNNGKKFKLSQLYKDTFEKKGVSIPQRCGDYDNFDDEFIRVIENIRMSIPDILEKELLLFQDYKMAQAAYNCAADLFDVKFSTFWTTLLRYNYKNNNIWRMNDWQLDVKLNSSWTEFWSKFNELGLTVFPDMEDMFMEVVSRRETYQKYQKKSETTWEKYRKFCEYNGMEFGSHVVSWDGFNILEYDDTNVNAEIILVQTTWKDEWEEVEFK